MPFYETTFLVRQDASTQQVENLTERFAAVIGDRGGKISKRENWGLRNLSYKIQKSRKAHYIFFNIDASPEAILEMERQMRINEDILRYLTIRVDTLDDQPSPLMQNRGGREGERERGGRFTREREGGGGGGRFGRGRDRGNDRERGDGRASDKSSEGGV